VNSRREFIRNFVFGTISLPLSFTKKYLDNERFRIKKSDMYYRRLGRTNLYISEICLGGSPVPPEPVFL